MQPRTRQAFTLIEILAVVILLSVVAAFMLSILPRNQAGLVTEADRLAGHLRYTQIRAQADIYVWRLNFIDNRTYELGPIVEPGPGFTPAPVPGTSTTTATLADGITAAPNTELWFDSWGRPLNAFGALMAGEQTITLTEGDRTVSLTLHPETGLIP